jgi:DNA-binding transcriptional regulator YiaG
MTHEHLSDHRTLEFHHRPVSGAAVRHARMTPGEFCEMVKSLGLTLSTAAVLLNVNVRTTHRWANDERKIPGPAAQFLRHLERNGKAVTKPKRPKVKDRAGMTFVAVFSDNVVTRMSTFTSLTNLDVGRGVRLSKAAYRSRKQTEVVPPIMKAHFERDGKVLAHYSPDALRGIEQ